MSKCGDDRVYLSVEAAEKLATELPKMIAEAKKEPQVPVAFRLHRWAWTGDEDDILLVVDASSGDHQHWTAQEIIDREA